MDARAETVSVIIKALNEERRIRDAVESALAAAAPYGGEVILADSGSTDRTVELAAAYPIRIVQLADPAERSCGIGPQLGFQHSGGALVCLMDGDMVLRPGFLDAAVARLRDRPDVAGVGGRVEEASVANFEFRRRAASGEAHLRAGPVDRLNGGGLYRRAAIESVGYLSDRNLHGLEEAELAARLAAAGWRLERLDLPAVTHHGHAEGSYRLLWRRLRSRTVWGYGEVLRAAAGRPHLPHLLRRLREFALWGAVLAWWAAVLLAALASPSAAALLAALPVAAMAVRRRSLAFGVFSVAAWCVHTLGLLCGLFRPRVDPRRPIASRILKDTA